MSTTTKYRTCHLCEAMCGLAIKVKDNQVVSIEGHADGWETISWDEAYDIVEREFKKIRKKYGNDAIGTYTGNPTVHNTGTAISLYDTINALNTKNRYASHSLDSVPVFLVNQMMFGHAMVAPIPDIDNLDYLLIIGANPMASNGSFMSTPDIKGKIKRIQQKGGKVVVIDPRKTETADKASEHYFIHPEKDVLFLLSIINELIKRDAVATSKAFSISDNFEELKKAAAPYDIEAVAPFTGIEAMQMHHIIDDLIKYPHSAVYGRLGVNTQSYGTVCQWLITSLNILLGQLDEEGGLMFTLPAIDYVTLMAHESKMFRYSSRVKSYQEIIGEFPTATIPDEILTKGENQIRGFITIAGNPARSSPNSALMEKALGDLEFMLAIDMYINETTKYANIILPPAIGLETMHYSFVLHIVATRNTTKFSPAPLKISKEQRYDWQIMGELQRRLFTGNFFQRIKSNIMSRIHPETKLDLALKTGSYGVWGGRFMKKNGISLKRLKKTPEGIELSPLTKVLPKRLFTKNKRIELAPPLFIKELEKVKELLTPQPKEKYPLKLIGRRHLRSNNSWMHNLPILDGGSRKCTVMIHQKDAVTYDIQPEETVEVYTDFGKILIEAEVTKDIIPGTISIPHGWGHHGDGLQLEKAQSNAGANINQLLDHDRLDPLSYTAAFNGHPVAIRKVTLN